MSIHASAGRKMRLEPLEARTLFAGLEADFLLAKSAVTGVGDFLVEFNPRFGNQQLVLTGQPGADLVIDFDRLPAFITVVTISDFDQVEFKGTDTLQRLIATDIRALDAPGITLTTGLFSTDVTSISLASAGDLAVLNGDATALTATSLSGTVVISDLDTLTLTSTTPDVFVISLNSDQVVKFTYEPAQISVVGLTDASKQILLPSSEDQAPPPGSVVVEVPPSEQTNAFLARLRELLGSLRTDENQQLLFDFVQHEDGFLSGLVQVRSAPAGLLLAAATPSPLTAADLQPVDLATLSSAGGSRPLTLGDYELAHLRTVAAAVEPTDFDTSVFEQPLPESAPGDLILAAAAPVPEVHAAAMSFEEVFGLLVAQSDRRPADLRAVLLDRFQAELLPGEQTAFLLVDPKPQRASGLRERESAFDIFD